MIRYENDCVGPCPMGCINCGREHNAHFYCDKCDCESDELYQLDGDVLCEDCFLESFTSKECDDMDDTCCVDCGDPAETLYDDDGEWVCEYCLKERYKIDWNSL